ncbi:DUF2238 domain-containing protein [Sulfurimonas marina]|uniref:DUF2238 domain-containing protein n=1 Tax=Sulfurimonas marina TaxID=2590551 RepID=A0A7M1AV47_9BACT|nr:DUF2238 domain-containing protein [Sulfurimonas marina]QOP41256.1 DUF2238 domain-containing protein [Sulfurimonas marina]
MNKYLWILTYLTILIWSLINPKDQFTWVLEVTPALIGGVVLLLTYNSFRLTPLLYYLILAHCIVLMVGGHYTYAEVPLFDSLKDFFGTQRNDYDKIGHIFQGFVPAMVAREILLRKNVVQNGMWLHFIVLSIILAISSLYELVEWWVAVATGDSAEAFLGTQGYVWDTQSDMAYALLGGILALITLTKLHNKQLSSLQ